MEDKRKFYSKEFKQKAVELSNVRGNVAEIARELDVNPEFIYRWRLELGLNPQQAFSGNGKKQLIAEQKEIERLKRALAEAQLERDILKKAVGIFSANDRKSTNSLRITRENFQLGRCVSL